MKKTDIGGPTLLRAAAKGRRIVICDRNDYDIVIQWIKEGQPEKDMFITWYAAKAEFKVADYALLSADYHSRGVFTGILGVVSHFCKYGENPWQTPAFHCNYIRGFKDSLVLGNFELIAGTDPSYNNLCDLDRILQTMTHIAAVFDENRQKVPAIAIAVKHGNACGVGIDTNPVQAIQKAVAGDPRAIFGGIVATNFEMTATVAYALTHHLMGSNQRRLLDVVIAPSFTTEAVGMLNRKGGKCRLLANEALASLTKESLDKLPRFRYVRGGFLVQPNYTYILDLQDRELEKLGQATPRREDDLLLAWAIGSTSNSNTITLVKDGMLIGNAVGQQDRISACELAVKRANNAYHITTGAVAYSDSFFPFTDGPQTLWHHGIYTILASSGSVRDEEIKQFCRDRKLTLYLIPDAKGRGFFDH